MCIYGVPKGYIVKVGWRSFYVRSAPLPTFQRAVALLERLLLAKAVARQRHDDALNAERAIGIPVASGAAHRGGRHRR